MTSLLGLRRRDRSRPAIAGWLVDRLARDMHERSRARVLASFACGLFAIMACDMHAKIVIANSFKLWYHALMDSINVGDRFTASHSGCRKFPLAVQVTCLNPVFPRVTVQDDLGTRIVGLHAMQACLTAGCIRKIHAKKQVTFLQSENKPCSLAGPVLQCSTVGSTAVSRLHASGA